MSESASYMQMQTVAFFWMAAFLEIAGCFAFWAWLRLGRPAWWGLVGTGSLVLFALCLTRIDVSHAGRAFAAYGGVYIASSLAWLWMAEGKQPDRWDAAGALICLAGASVILWGPRT
jgi:small multidrug resistance family-3 protein